MIKLIISLLFFILLSCEQISKDKVLNQIENTKDIIEEKTNKNITKIKESNNKNKKNEQIDNKIFYFIGEPYYIEGVKYKLGFIRGSLISTYLNQLNSLSSSFGVNQNNLTFDFLKINKCEPIISLEDSGLFIIRPGFGWELLFKCGLILF